MLYKPQSQYMFPRNNQIANNTSNTFSCVVNGNQVTAYILNMLYLQSSTGNWVEFYNTANTIVSLGSSLYNGDTLSITISSNTIGGISTGAFLNRQIGWRISLLGAISNSLSATGVAPYIGLSNHNFRNGEQVWISGGTSMGIAYVGVVDSNTIWLSTSRERVLAYNTTDNVIDRATVVGYYLYPMSQSDVIPFRTINKGTFTLSDNVVSTTAEYNAQVSYAQDNNIPINYFIAYFDVLMGSEWVRTESERIYSSNVSYTYTGLISGNSYKMQIIGYDIYDMEYDTGIKNLTASYTIPEINVGQVAENKCQDSAINVRWNSAYQIIGDFNGTTYDVYQDVITGDKYLELDIDSYVEFTPINKISGGSLPVFIWKPASTSFTGDICKLESADHTFIISYNNATGRISHSLDGVSVNDGLLTLTSGKKYLVGVTSSGVYISEFNY